MMRIFRTPRDGSASVSVVQSATNMAGAASRLAIGGGHVEVGSRLGQDGPARPVDRATRLWEQHPRPRRAWPPSQHRSTRGTSSLGPAEVPAGPASRIHFRRRLRPRCGPRQPRPPGRRGRRGRRRPRGRRRARPRRRRRQHAGGLHAGGLVGQQQVPQDLHGRIGRATRGRAWRHRPPDLLQARRLMIHQITRMPWQCSTKMLRARPHHMLKRHLVTLQTVGTWGSLSDMAVWQIITEGGWHGCRIPIGLARPGRAGFGLFSLLHPLPDPGRPHLVLLPRPKPPHLPPSLALLRLAVDHRVGPTLWHGYG